MNLTCLTPPAREPLTLEEAREYLRLPPDLHTEDALVHALIYTARVTLEAATNRAWLTQRWSLGLDGFWSVTPRHSHPGLDAFWGVLRLPKNPVQAVVSIQYVDTAGATQTLPPANYQVDVATKPARIAPAYGTVWPAIRPVFNAVTIVYDAGYGDNLEDVPEPLRVAMRLMVGTLWENREMFVAGEAATALMPFSVRQLIAAHKIPVYG